MVTRQLAISAALAFSVCFPASMLRAEPPASAGGEATPAAELIEQLGSASFIGRETASQQLIRLGNEAITALEIAVEHPDPEIRLRSQRILELVREQVREQQLIDFAAATEDTDRFNLPGWPAYRKLLGDDAAARSLFVQMQKQEPYLLRLADEHPERVGAAFTARCQQLQQAMGVLRQQVTLGSVAALVFVASRDGVPPAAQTDSLVYSFCLQPVFQTAMAGDQHALQLRTLLGAWIGKASGTHQSLMLAMRYDITAGIQVANKLISGGPVHYRQYAIFALAKLGGDEQIPQLEKLLEDRTVCYSTRTRDRKVVQGLVCDVALLGLLHLSEQDPTKYGLANVRPNDHTLYQPNAQYFTSEDQRKAAIAKWREFRQGRAVEEPVSEKPGSQPPDAVKPTGEKPDADPPEDK